MEYTLVGAIGEIVSMKPHKIIISNKRKSGSPYKKINILKIQQKSGVGYQAEKFTETQVFHENFSVQELLKKIKEYIDEGFCQIDGFTGSGDFNLKITKKGKVLFHKIKALKTGEGMVVNSYDSKGSPTVQTLKSISEINKSKENPYKDLTEIETEGIVYQHNKQKNYLLQEDTIIAPLVDMGIFNAEGKVVKSMYDKYRQINRFLEIVNDAITAEGLNEITIVDFGCGKSYLTFILYYYLTYVKGIKANMIGLDLKADVIGKCNEAARRYGYENLSFQIGDINGYHSDRPVDMVITLHACDTATDYALFNAICWGVKIILSVPCCQHELNSQILTDSFGILTRYGIIKERVAALMTDSIRGNLLEACGYKTQILEFIDITHTPKNLLIRGVKKNLSEKKKNTSVKQAEDLMLEFHLNPTLYRLLKNEGMI